MPEKEPDIRKRIQEELKNQFPDLNVRVVRFSKNNFTYELEKHRNYSYYTVKFVVTDEGNLEMDWDHPELTIV